MTALKTVILGGTTAAAILLGAARINTNKNRDKIHKNKHFDKKTQKFSTKNYMQIIQS